MKVYQLETRRDMSWYSIVAMAAGGAALAGLLYVVIAEIPSLRRYIRIRSM
jgi:hypothetical protein